MVAQPASTTAADGPGCDDCAACDLALERPSGINAVDSWMEKQRQRPPRSTVHSPPPARHRSASLESHTVASNGTSRRSSHAELPSLPAADVSAVPTLHGGLLTSEASKDSEAEDVRAELVLVHPKCAACLEVVRRKGVGVLSSVNAK